MGPQEIDFTSKQHNDAARLVHFELFQIDMEASFCAKVNHVGIIITRSQYQASQQTEFMFRTYDVQSEVHTRARTCLVKNPYRKPLGAASSAEYQSAIEMDNST